MGFLHCALRATEAAPTLSHRLCLTSPAAAEYRRLKYTGGAISAYEEEPIVSSGAVGLGCGFGYVGEEFQVCGTLCSLQHAPSVLGHPQPGVVGQCAAQRRLKRQRWTCTLGGPPPLAQGAYIGVGSSFYNKGFSCGRCVKIQVGSVHSRQAPALAALPCSH